MFRENLSQIRLIYDKSAWHGVFLGPNADLSEDNSATIRQLSLYHNKQSQQKKV